MTQHDRQTEPPAGSRPSTIAGAGPSDGPPGSGSAIAEPPGVGPAPGPELRPDGVSRPEPSRANGARTPRPSNHRSELVDPTAHPDTTSRRHPDASRARPSDASGTSATARRRQVLAAVIAGALLILTYGLLVVGVPRNSQMLVAIDNLGGTAAALLASVLAIGAARAQRLPRARISWLLLGLGMASWAAGDIYAAWNALVLGAAPTVPSPADLGYLTMLPLALAGVLLRPTMRPRDVGPWLLLLDACLAMAAILAVAWVLVLGPMFDLLDMDPIVQAVTLAYPIGDLGILFCLVVTTLRETENRPASALMLVALAMLAVADAGYLPLAAHRTSYTGHPLDVLWFAGLIVLALAAVVEHDQPLEASPTPPPSVGAPWLFMAPAALLAIASLVVWLAVARRAGETADPSQIAIAVAWALLLVRIYHGYRATATAHRRERQLRIDHAGSFRQEQKRRRQLEAVRDVAAELTRELDLTTLLGVITRRAANLVDAPIGAAMLWDEAAGVLVPRAWNGVGSWYGRLRWRLGEGAAGEAARLRRGVIVNGYPYARAAFGPLLQRASISAALATPITYQGRLVGIIFAADERSGRTFGRRDLELLELFADQAAVAIEHARLFEQAASVEALRELARLKAEFLSTASHELRTPLTLIHGYAELLHVRADALDPTEVAAMADEILLGSRTMIRLVDDLLDFSRLESRRPELERRDVDIVGLLERHVASWQQQPGGNRLTLESTGPLTAWIDPTRFGQVVDNLVGNGLNHAPAGPIVVRARRADGWLSLEVQDHGPGVPDTEKTRIWETFFRGERAVNSPNRGSGLGLAVVKQLVELHGGRVGVENIPGSGATFRVWLPAEEPS
ncbi:MAG: GAF domain-containing sensor histidine kinase [Chloroflexi bacterium]|nr:GAF domain-containing sensor histidine kinase [Chloroflexota bacterium]